MSRFCQSTGGTVGCETTDTGAGDQTTCICDGNKCNKSTIIQTNIILISLAVFIYQVFMCNHVI